MNTIANEKIMPYSCSGKLLASQASAMIISTESPRWQQGQPLHCKTAKEQASYRRQSVSSTEQSKSDTILCRQQPQ